MTKVNATHGAHGARGCTVAIVRAQDDLMFILFSDEDDEIMAEARACFVGTVDGIDIWCFVDIKGSGMTHMALCPNAICGFLGL